MGPVSCSDSRLTSVQTATIQVPELPMNQPLDYSFYERDPETVARELLGMHLIRKARQGLTSGRIVEVEAYMAHNDPACHASRGKTRRNATMFGPPGRAYVYSIHARFCLNAVTEAKGVPSAVLIRAIEPLSGIPLMDKRRGITGERNLPRGPARLCEAFGIDRALDGWNLTTGKRLWIASAEKPDPSLIATSPRVGISSAKDLRLRFFLQNSPFLSR